MRRVAHSFSLIALFLLLPACTQSLPDWVERGERSDDRTATHLAKMPGISCSDYETLAYRQQCQREAGLAEELGPMPKAPASIERTSKAAPLRAIPMSEVMRDCEKALENKSGRGPDHLGDDFSAYASCIKSTYNRMGTTPSSPVVHEFYSYLDEIEENYRNRRVTTVHSKAATYRAWKETIDADNKIRQAGIDADNRAKEAVTAADEAERRRLLMQLLLR